MFFMRRATQTQIVPEINAKPPAWNVIICL